MLNKKHLLFLPLRLLKCPSQPKSKLPRIGHQFRCFKNVKQKRKIHWSKFYWANYKNRFSEDLVTLTQNSTIIGGVVQHKRRRPGFCSKLCHILLQALLPSSAKGEEQLLQSDWQLNKTQSIQQGPWHIVGTRKWEHNISVNSKHIVLSNLYRIYQRERYPNPWASMHVSQGGTKTQIMSVAQPVSRDR